MDKKIAKKELEKINKINTFGWTLDEIIDLNNYKQYLINIIGGKNENIS